MKYVCFQRRNMIIPVIVPDHCTHADIKIEGFKPISAGFFSIEYVEKKKISDGKVMSRVEVIINDSGSDSLGLGSRIEDKKLIENTLLNSGMYAFMSF